MRFDRGGDENGVNVAGVIALNIFRFVYELGYEEMRPIDIFLARDQEYLTYLLIGTLMIYPPLLHSGPGDHRSIQNCAEKIWGRYGILTLTNVTKGCVRAAMVAGQASVGSEIGSHDS